jgi:hypothetical protein
MKNYPNQITLVSELFDLLERSIICLTDIAESGNVQYRYVTCNSSFVELYFGDNKLNRLADKSESSSEEVVVMLDVVSGKIISSTPTLFTGIVQKVSSLNKPNSKNKTAEKLDFDTNKFLDNKGKKVKLLSNLGTGEFRYLFKSKDKPEVSVYQVNELGIDQKGIKAVSNKLVQSNENEIEGYLFLYDNKPPLFMAKEHVAKSDLRKNIHFPCIAYRNEDSTLNDLVVLANKMQGEL